MSQVIAWAVLSVLGELDREPLVPAAVQASDKALDGLAGQEIYVPQVRSPAWLEVSVCFLRFWHF
jgi:hypothetical protein